MAKKIKATIKFQITAGKANPAPPVGPALGQHGLNIMEFCNAFNALTANMDGLTIPVIVTVFEDRTYTFITKTPPTADLIKKEISLAKGSGTPNKTKVGSVSMDILKKVAEMKLKDMNTKNMDSALAMVVGTAKSIGLNITE
ncbi:MAG: 50S ribosomal protein L11 [bacterium]